MHGQNLMPKLKPTAVFLPSPIEQRGGGTPNTQPPKLQTDASVHMHRCCLLFPSQAPTHPAHINPAQAAVTLPQRWHNQITFPQPMTDISLVPMSGETLSAERSSSTCSENELLVWPLHLEWEQVVAVLAVPGDFAHGSAILSHGNFAS